MTVSPLLLAALFARAADPPPLGEASFSLDAQAEVAARVTASCAQCDWGRKGQEAAALELRVDGRYSQHLFLIRGAERAEYRVSLGRLAAGSHHLTLDLDRRRSARRVREATVSGVLVEPARPGSREERLLAHAPILEARPNSLGKFSDVPLVTWVETDDLDSGAVRLRYSVVFSNEDGGTPPDRLMATWGRLTDLEFVYGVELDGQGQVTAARYQGSEHRILEFAGAREGARPVLYVVTDNNMVSDRGPRTLRYAPAPVAFDLTRTSREAVMDAHPWTYAVSAREVRREGRVKEGARPGSQKLPDPRRFLTLEACATTEDATLAYSAGVRQANGQVRWFASDAGLPGFRIGRQATEFPNGCFRGAVALPAQTTAADVVALRLRAFTRLPRKDEAPLAPGSGRARLERVNSLFFLGADDRPVEHPFSWQGQTDLLPEGPPAELKIRD